ncbi:MAG: hypothetical protein GF365_05155 [Candidatus Buchananbacteria bacterium]|nr:hypothetical protein [Candidatus Buchananbacteria bacterium]
MLEGLISPEELRLILTEIREEISANGESSQEKASLFHQLGSVYGLLGNQEKQKSAWQQALQLDPGNITIKTSLKSLSV